MTVVVGWAALLFFCFGLLATFNWISFLAQLLGSLAVAAAFFMILEFSSPYSGLSTGAAAAIASPSAGSLAPL
jgi:hypothetical protein